ncbi:MAG: hypothetical protein HBSAPP03_29470 [Phycisphaerae bacterium]|nr:MAG: hypothetical protein HBSAPP03_29470 [Phycisphaerae bacterium]
MNIVASGRSARRACAGGFAALAAAASPALAVLGSFGPNEGYSLSVYSGGYNWADVTYYNAGAYGPAAGGGSGPNFIAPDSGLWRLVSNAGGFFSNSAARNATLGGAPPYPTTHPTGVPAYLVGAHFPGRNNDGYNLAIRNDTPSGSGPVTYDYDLDIYDTGGSNAAATTSGVVTSQFYYLADPDMPYQPGTPRQDKFTMSFMDALGNIGLQWGYSRDNMVAWRDSPSAPWNYTGIQALPTSWDGVKVSMDLTADTFGIDYYDAVLNTWSSIVPAGTPMGMNMANFTTIRWQLEDSVHLGIGGKNMFDDFSFGGFIPSPAGGAVLAMGMMVLGRRRRS